MDHRQLKNIILLNWNANGINNKKHELNYFLNNYEIDIACITETHITTPEFYIPNYKTIKMNRSNRKGGGSLILIKNNIEFTLNNITVPNNTETVAINITLNNTCTTIIACYCPPNINLDTTSFRSFFNTPNHLILLGDLNAKHSNWACKSTNRNGRQLNNLINALNLKIISLSEPTYYPLDSNKNPDILDIALTNFSLNATSTVVHELDSDHL